MAKSYECHNYFLHKYDTNVFKLGIKQERLHTVLLTTPFHNLNYEDKQNTSLILLPVKRTKHKASKHDGHLAT